MRKELLDGEQVFVVHDFLSPDECRHYVELSESAGYGDAPVSTGFGPVMAPSVRNNERVMVDNFDWAAALWDRFRPFAPSPFDGYPAVGLNERFRFYRYDPGQTFRPHSDGYFARNGQRSRLTFMVYLNGGVGGGETVIYFQGDGADHEAGGVLTVTPEAGKLLVFRHELLHEGAPVRSGRKYVLRSDVMYRYARPAGE